MQKATLMWQFTVLAVYQRLCRNGSHVAAYEDGLKGKTDSQKKLTKHHQVTRDEFISHKLAPKLAQQLKVVLHACTCNCEAETSAAVHTGSGECMFWVVG